MSSLRNHDRSRWLTTGLAAAAAAAALLFVPVSYDTVVGHEVTLELRGAQMDVAQVKAIAAGLGSVLKSTDVAIRDVLSAPGAPEALCRLTARVANRSKTQVERTAAAFAADLANRGLAADVGVTPVVEHVTGNVCMAAANAFVEIRIDAQGGTDEEVAAEIRSQLAAAGIEEANVSVDRTDGCCKIAIQIGPTGGRELPEIRCVSDGEPACVQKAIRVHRTPGMTDADVVADVERQLADQGITATVSMGPDGQIRIEALGDCP